MAPIDIWGCGGSSGASNIAFKPKLGIETVHDGLQVSYGCACSVKNRTVKRSDYGSRTLTEYETHILAFCSVREDGRVAWA